MLNRKPPACTASQAVPSKVTPVLTGTARSVLKLQINAVMLGVSFVSLFFHLTIMPAVRLTHVVDRSVVSLLVLLSVSIPLC